MSHIIIEGFDATGKSWLAKELSKRLYMPVINRLKPKENIFIECVDTLTKSPENYIIDRFHLSEEAYGPVKRVKSRFDFRQLKIIEMLMLTQRTFNIYCHNEVARIQEVFEKNKHEKQYPTLEEIAPILNQFDIALDNSILRWHKYQYGDSVDSLVELIKSYFQNTQDTLGGIQVWKDYRTIGNLEGSVLIVGDKYGDKLLPPLVPFGNNEPGLKLFKSIKNSNLYWNDIIITNAFKKNEKKINSIEAIQKELSLPNVKLVIALGNN